ncbi:MAG: Hsp20/alpha crystallin family protein [Acetobacteraceae bacterium]|nr:Hsp20/alpha crystallin family protein [Acetobacteraceae bacterium]
MGLMRWSPFEELAGYRHGVGRLFPEGGWPVWEGLGYPAVDMYETGDEVVLSADLPGYDPARLQVSVSSNQVLLSGEVGTEREEGRPREDYHRRERRWGAFHRAIGLPARVNPEGARATYRHGLLELRMPKQERERPRRIEIET